MSGSSIFYFLSNNDGIVGLFLGTRTVRELFEQTSCTYNVGQPCTEYIRLQKKKHESPQTFSKGRFEQIHTSVTRFLRDVREEIVRIRSLVNVKSNGRERLGSNRHDSCVRAAATRFRNARLVQGPHRSGTRALLRSHSKRTDRRPGNRTRSGLERLERILPVFVPHTRNTVKQAFRTSNDRSGNVMGHRLSHFSFFENRISAIFSF